MKNECLPQIWSPQQVVFTNTALPSHLGIWAGLGKHFSVRVWLLHVHRLQLDCHTSPGCNEGIEIYYIYLYYRYYYFCFDWTKILTILGSPSGPLQPDGQEKKLYLITVYDNMLCNKNASQSKIIALHKMSKIAYVWVSAFYCMHVTHRGSPTHRCVSDFLPSTGRWDKNSLDCCSRGRLQDIALCTARREIEKMKTRGKTFWV